MNVQAFLSRAGYRSVDLATTAVGHLYVEGRLDDRPVTVLVDTGASDTVIDEGFARGLGLQLKAVRRRGAGAGGSGLRLHSIKSARLVVGEIEVAPLRILVMDLSHVAAALGRKGVPPPQVILGSDVLKRSAAVIDYASGKMFFAPDAPAASS